MLRTTGVEIVCVKPFLFKKVGNAIVKALRVGWRHAFTKFNFTMKFENLKINPSIQKVKICDNIRPF